MKAKIEKCMPLNAELKTLVKTTLKKKSQIDLLTKPSKKDPKSETLHKLSTLDTWLQTLYQTKSVRKEILSNKNRLMKKIDKVLKPPPRLFVKLEQVNLQQLKNGNNNLQSEGNILLEHTEFQNDQTKRKLKVGSLVYKNRSSEYIKLANKEYKCAKCDFTSYNLASVRAHFDKEHNDNLLKCNLCPFETSQQYYFNSHVKCHSKPDLECTYCKKMIKWFSYKMHMKTHERSDNTEYRCNTCEYSSYNHANVKRHMLARHKNPHELQPYKCNSCDYVTILEERLKQHKKVVHSKEGVWLTCPQCEYTTRNKSHMTRHVNDLHSEKKIKCTQCSRSFSSRANLKYHIQRKHSEVHTRKFLYCEMCPKDGQYKTTEKGNLVRHILAHRTLDEIEVFACHKCPYLGKSKTALKTHLINSHLSEMHNFKCQICGYSTNTKSRYNHHVRDVHGKPKSEKYKRFQTNDFANQPTDSVDYSRNKDFEDINVKEEIDECDSNEEAPTDQMNKHITLTELWIKQENLQG